MNAFTTTVDPTDEGSKIVDDEDDLVDFKFEKMNDQNNIHTAYEKLYKVSKKHEKLYKLATKKLSDVELNREELSTKFDEVNQTIGALRFKNNFLVKKTKKLEIELFQVKTHLERTSSVKLDKMLSFQKSASDRIGLEYDFSSPSIASSSTTVFVSLANKVEFENNDVKAVLARKNIEKNKSVLGAPPKLIRKRLKTLGLRRAILKSLNKRSSISANTVEQLDILDLIAICG